MFQTDIIRFVQSLQTPEITFVMKMLTVMGYKEFIVVLLISIFAGVDFKKGFLLMQVVIITGLLTEFLKNAFALPRPWFVDSSLDTFGKNFEGIKRFSGNGADTFWGTLPGNIIQSYRSLRPDSYGLPSGHTSSAIALWGTIILVFKNKWIRVVSVLLLLLVPLSRIYLARHFLADVLGGYLIGCLIFILFYLVILNPSKLKYFLESLSFTAYRTKRDFFLLLYLFVLPLLFYFTVPPEFVELCGYLVGLNAAFILISIRNYPSINTTILRRFSRIILTILIFFIIGALITLLTRIIFPEQIKIIYFLKGFLIIFLAINISEIFMRLLGLSGSGRN